MEKIKILIQVNKGMIEKVDSNYPQIEIAVLDYDLPDSVINMAGIQISAGLFEIKAEIEPEVVEHYFNQL